MNERAMAHARHSLELRNVYETFFSVPLFFSRLLYISL